MKLRLDLYESASLQLIKMKRLSYYTVGRLYHFNVSKLENNVFTLEIIKEGWNRECFDIVFTYNTCFHKINFWAVFLYQLAILLFSPAFYKKLCLKKYHGITQQ